MPTRDTPNVSFRRNSIKVLISLELKTILAVRKPAIDYLIENTRTLFSPCKTIDFVSLTYLVFNTLDIHGLEGQY